MTPAQTIAEGLGSRAVGWPKKFYHLVMGIGWDLNENTLFFLSENISELLFAKAKELNGAYLRGPPLRHDLPRQWSRYESKEMKMD